VPRAGIESISRESEGVLKTLVLILAAVLVLSGCDDKPSEAAPAFDGKGKPVPTITDYSNDLSRYGSTAGVAGVFEVRSMLCIAKADSAPMPRVAERISATYALLEREMDRLKAQPEGYAGQITYNNDTSNFRFKCFYLIKQMPGNEPDSSTLTLLKPGRMLVYNHYGPYSELYLSYAKIREHMKSAGLLQTGPMREIYITSPAEQTDTQRWLTLIMVPVGT
jgi:effector-binding domain-containing protein